MLPTILLGGTIPGSHLIPTTSRGIINIYRKSAVTKNDTLNGYLPKNAKMYTYPYNFFHVDNGSGSELTLRYEFFENNKPVLEMSGTITQPVQMTVRPDNYKGVLSGLSGGYKSLNTETLQLNNFPMCSWNVDAYQAWIAQNAIPVILNTASQAAQSVVASSYSANPEGMLVGGSIGMVAGLLGQFYQASMQADISKGNFIVVVVAYLTSTLK